MKPSRQTDDADDAADEVTVEVVDVDAVEQHLAARRLVVTAEEGGNGALSGAGASDDSNVLSRMRHDI